MDIGKRIKDARKKAGFTQKKLAERCGLATGTIQQYELGKRQPRLEQLGKIAKALEVDWIDLYTDFHGDRPDVDIYQLHSILESIINEPYDYSQDEKEKMTILINTHIDTLRQITNKEQRTIYFDNAISTVTNEILGHLLSPYSDKNVEDIARLVAFYLQLNAGAKGLVIKMVEYLYGNKELRGKNENPFA